MEMTKTPVKQTREQAMSPIPPPSDRSTPTRHTPTRQSDHLNKILGKARTAKRTLPVHGQQQRGSGTEPVTSAHPEVLSHVLHVFELYKAVFR